MKLHHVNKDNPAPKQGIRQGGVCEREPAGNVAEHGEGTFLAIGKLFQQKESSFFYSANLKRVFHNP